MIIGIPKEIKDHEYRVGATPAMVHALVEAGHTVKIQTDAGTRIGISDEDFEKAGGVIVDTPKEAYEAEMVIKVKEPQPAEYPYFRPGLILFCYLHLAPEPGLTRELIKNGVSAIAFETVTDNDGQLPLLIPMSEVAGRISIQAGANCLQMNAGGNGMLLGGVPGVPPANVAIIGGGIVGTQAARMAVGLGADVTIFDASMKRLRQLENIFGSRVKLIYSTPLAIEACLPKVDLVIGAVLIPGKVAPKVLTRKMIRKMSPGSVIVDVSIDQGGCVETAKPTSHSSPTYVVDGVVHYCVTNMPGACGRTSTYALAHSTMSYALKIANLGFREALLRDPNLMNGLNVYEEKVTNQAVAFDLGYKYHSAEELLGATTQV